jgi:(+)-trans-carveol dehydrogenase
VTHRSLQHPTAKHPRGKEVRNGHCSCGHRRLRRLGTETRPLIRGRVDGKVAFITGAARGIGRSHAIRLAEEGADIIALDVASQVKSVPVPMATSDDLAQTVKAVKAVGRQIIALKADVRDFSALKAALDEAVAHFGRLDIVAANAGIISFSKLETMSEQSWQDVIDTNLTGSWHTAKAAIPHLRANGRGGSIVLTSSAAGLRAHENIGHYVAAKHGLVGLMRTLALELASDMIRVNSIHPGSVLTDVTHDPNLYALFAPDLPASERTTELVTARHVSANALPIPWVETLDISNALLWLASEEARYVTGVALPVDAGSLIK